MSVTSGITALSLPAPNVGDHHLRVCSPLVKVETVADVWTTAATTPSTNTPDNNGTAKTRSIAAATSSCVVRHPPSPPPHLLLCFRPAGTPDDKAPKGRQTGRKKQQPSTTRERGTAAMPGGRTREGGGVPTGSKHYICQTTTGGLTRTQACRPGGDGRSAGTGAGGGAFRARGRRRGGR